MILISVRIFFRLTSSYTESNISIDENHNKQHKLFYSLTEVVRNNYSQWDQ